MIILVSKEVPAVGINDAGLLLTFFCNAHAGVLLVVWSVPFNVTT